MSPITSNNIVLRKRYESATSNVNNKRREKINPHRSLNSIPLQSVQIMDGSVYFAFFFGSSTH